MQSLLTPEQKDQYILDIEKDYARARDQHANKKGVKLLSLEAARLNKSKLQFDKTYTPKVPKFIGKRVFKNIDLSLIAPYIDWSPFFQTWDLVGFYPAILNDPIVGKSATQVFNEAQAMLTKLINNRALVANGVVAFYPANSIDDDIEIFEDESRTKTLFTYYGLRQQSEKPKVDNIQKPNQCLSDFIAPKSSGIKDYIGVFAVTSGLGMEKYEKEFKDKFEKKGMIFSGLSPDNKLPEIIELKNHPWFIGVQFHPEFKSRPLAPHPLFSSFIKAAKNHK